ASVSTTLMPNETSIDSEQQVLTSAPVLTTHYSFAVREAMTSRSLTLRTQALANPVLRRQLIPPDLRTARLRRYAAAPSITSIWAESQVQQLQTRSIRSCLPCPGKRSVRAPYTCGLITWAGSTTSPWAGDPTRDR